MNHANHDPQAHRPMRDHAYLRLAGMAILSFLAMYVLMYAMVDALANVFHNINQVYMAALMAVPMVWIELALMRGMYRNRALNVGIAAIALLVGVGCWFGIRKQVGVTDQQFLRSMIPHHAGAVLMCRQNRMRDPDLRQLCREIVRSQEDEIARMKAKLR